jgi:hypothetical protein
MEGLMTFSKSHTGLGEGAQEGDLLMGEEQAMYH